MRWQGRRQSENVEDRRGMSVGRVALGGGATIVILVVAMLFGADPRVLLQQMQGLDTSQPTQQTAPDPAQDELAKFASTILADTEDVWKSEFEKMGREYADPHLVLFTDRVESACGLAGAAAGPFYCPGDSKLYLDLAFFDVMQRQLGAPGDFAQAYVIAHEVGHHVQKLTGRMKGGARSNQESVRIELQADCYAGVWGHHAGAMNQLSKGDIEEALNAATAIGDDRLQKQTQGRVVPESFTHGSSEQRVRWFKRGMDSGRPQDCDTSAARTP